MTGAGTIVWKEWRELFLPAGRPNRQLLGLLVAMIAMPLVLLPIVGGDAEMWASMTGGLMGFFPMFTVFSFVIDAFAGERERHTLETLLATRLSDRAILLGKLLALLSFALAFTAVAAVVLVVLTVLVLGTGADLVFALVSFLVGLVAAIHVSAFGALAGIIISMKVPTVRVGQQIFALAVMLPFMMLPSVVLPLVTSSDRGLATLLDWLPVLLVAVPAGFYTLLLGLLLVALRLFRRDRLLAR